MGVVYFDLDMELPGIQNRAGLFLMAALYQSLGGLSAVGESVRGAAAAERERDSGKGEPSHLSGGDDPFVDVFFACSFIFHLKRKSQNKMCEWERDAAGRAGTAGRFGVGVGAHRRAVSARGARGDLCAHLAGHVRAGGRRGEGAGGGAGYKLNALGVGSSNTCYR
jgi:hypothetical protein